VVATDAGLQSLLPLTTLRDLSSELLRRTSRHRFRQHLAHVAAQAQVAGE
jgi:hypothetical protein